MEELELKCPSCRQFFDDPILLQCSHSYCRQCAFRQQQKVSPLSPPCSSSSGASDTMSVCVSDADQESDKLSVSETDSGVYIFGSGIGGESSTGPGTNNSACSSRGSRPSSFLGCTSSLQNHSHQHAQTPRPSTILTPSAFGYTLNCDACHKTSFYADEHAIQRQPVNLALQRLVQRYRRRSKTPDGPSTSQTLSDCKFCEDNARPVTLFCDSCGFFFCDSCKPIVHPFRGPLKEHTIVPANSAIIKKSVDLASTDPPIEHCCSEHSDEILTMFCLVCNTPVCCQCIKTPRHNSHNVQSLSTTVKTHKSDLSKTLQELSEKAKRAHEGINQLKQLQEQINTNCEEFKSTVNVQVDALIQAIENRRSRLLEFVDSERDSKRQALRDQVSRCNSYLGKTTGLIQFCIEVLKENDAVAYLQVGNGLQNRTTEAEFLWNKNMNTRPEVDSEFVLNLDTKPLQYAVQSLEFVQLKALRRRSSYTTGDSVSRAPNKPFFIASDCSAENNSVVLVWNVHQNGIAVDGFVLELDSGRDDGRFKTVYKGPESTITIDGLHFDSCYNARVKAFNGAGESPFSDPICLQTAHVAWFQLCKSQSQHDILLTNESSSATGLTLDYGVILGTCSFSRGIHYFEVTVDRLDINTDLALGVASPAVNRHSILGKDIHGWAMYIDERRSWYLHGDTHTGRRDGGISSGAVIGVCLDCDRGRVQFFINDRPLIVDGTEFAFRNMPRSLYYPAISVNKNVKVTLHTGLQPPCSITDSTSQLDAMML
ncbi:hypothetical protein M3Y95_00198400 [Aphelenchoides besseyi]|nr:hypothetical protein M3Y95_00198400 [Aphelenchoides besseyi]